MNKHMNELTIIKSFDFHISCLPCQKSTKNKKNPFETIEGAGEVDLIVGATLPHYWYDVHLTFGIWKLLRNSDNVSIDKYFSKCKILANNVWSG